jgi:hypothetical protein
MACAPSPRAPASNWAEEEFATVRWYDERLKRRLVSLALDFFHRPQANVPEACASRAARWPRIAFFRNRQVNLQAILTPHIEATIERIRAAPHRPGPAGYDDAQLFPSSRHRRAGPVNTTRDQAIGLLLHDTVAFSVEGTPLGILDAQCWARDPDEHGKSEERKNLPIEEKESMKWLNSFTGWPKSRRCARKPCW